jgi:hypothetical protein
MVYGGVVGMFGVSSRIVEVVMKLVDDVQWLLIG